MSISRIAIHGVPRSGTSWIGSIFDSCPSLAYRHQPLFSYAFKNAIDETSSEAEIDGFFQKLLKSDDDFVLQKEAKQAGHIPSFEKTQYTHIAYKEARHHHVLENLLRVDSSITVVGIIRNPKSVIASWFNAPKEFDKEKWNLLDEWQYAQSKNKGLKQEFYGYLKWKQVGKLFLQLEQQYPERFYLLNYSDLLSDTQNQVRALFEFCNIKYDQQTIEFLSHSQNHDLSHQAYSVYRKNHVDDKWKTQLPNEIVDAIDEDLRGTHLGVFLE